jgi:hypothetical protein
MGYMIVDSFQSCDHLKGKNRTYKNVKAAVLEAGEFSLADAMQDAKSARLFERLTKDPELVVTQDDFPWYKVERSIRFFM